MAVLQDHIVECCHFYPEASAATTFTRLVSIPTGVTEEALLMLFLEIFHLTICLILGDMI